MAEGGNAGRNPRDIKVMFAQEIVARFHSKQDAEMALADFDARFRRGVLPDDMMVEDSAC